MLGVLSVLMMGLCLGYDYNLQVVELPGTVCQQHTRCPEYRQLRPDSLNYHGLWPNKLDGHHPFFCSQDQYDPAQLTPPTRTALDSVWTGLYNSTYWFRYHEYTKHGTCFQLNNSAAQLQDSPQLQEKHQETYFRIAVGLLQKSQLSQVLFSKSKTKDSFFTLQELSKNIQNRLGVKEVRLSCAHHGSQQMLLSIGVCWTRDLRPMNCPSDFSTNCHAARPLLIRPFHAA